MIIKSHTDRFEELANKIKELHSYSVPEVIALPIVDGLRGYLAWIREMTRAGNGG